MVLSEARLASSSDVFDSSPVSVSCASVMRLFRSAPRAFDVLLILVEAEGDLVTKEELLARAWPGA